MSLRSSGYVPAMVKAVESTPYREELLVLAGTWVAGVEASPGGPSEEEAAVVELLGEPFGSPGWEVDRMSDRGRLAKDSAPASASGGRLFVKFRKEIDIQARWPASAFVAPIRISSPSLAGRTMF